MEKLFQFTSKWSNIDSGLKAGPGGLQTQEAGLPPSLSLTLSLSLIEIQIITTSIRVSVLPN